MSDEIATSAHPHSDSDREKTAIELEVKVDETTDFQRGVRFWAILIGLGITNLLGALENTVVTTSAPFIVTDLGLNGDYIWITNAFFVAREEQSRRKQKPLLYSAAFQPLFGQLCNVCGRRWVTLVIVAIFTLGSGICGGANNGATLIAGRTVQGIGSGGIIMVIDIIVSDLVPLRQRGTYMAVILAIYGVGTTLGPFIGGEIVERTTWRWVFYINLPFGGSALILLYLALHVNYNKEMTLAQKLKRIDIAGNAILIASTVSVLFALATGGSQYPWSSWRVLVPFILGLFGFLLFGLFEVWGFAVEPVIPPRLFSNRTSVIVSINTFLNSALLYWIIYFLPVYFQAVRLYGPAYTGVVVLPQSLVGIPGAAISAIALSRWGRYKPLHFIGFTLFALGIGLFSTLNESSSRALWATYQSIAAIGAGMVLNTQLPAFQAPVSEADQAASTAAWCFVRTFGNVWGVAIPAVIFNNQISVLAHRISDAGVRDLLLGGNAYQYGSASYVASLPHPVQDEVISVYRDALHVVFQVGIAWAGFAAVLSLFEKEIPLRTELETEYGLRDGASQNDSKD